MAMSIQLHPAFPGPEIRRIRDQRGADIVAGEVRSRVIEDRLRNSDLDTTPFLSSARFLLVRTGWPEVRLHAIPTPNELKFGAQNGLYLGFRAGLVAVTAAMNPEQSAVFSEVTIEEALAEGGFEVPSTGLVGIDAIAKAGRNGKKALPLYAASTDILAKRLGGVTNSDYVQAGAGVAFAGLGVVAPDLGARFEAFQIERAVEDLTRPGSPTGHESNPPASDTTAEFMAIMRFNRYELR